MVIAGIDGPVLLVGHSYGGSVTTAAGTADNVTGLVYLAGFAPDEGENLTDLQSRFPEPAIVPFVVQHTLPDGGAEFDLIPENFPSLFCAGEGATVAGHTRPPSAMMRRDRTRRTSAQRRLRVHRPGPLRPVLAGGPRLRAPPHAPGLGHDRRPGRRAAPAVLPAGPRPHAADLARTRPAATGARGRARGRPRRGRRARRRAGGTAVDRRRRRPRGRVVPGLRRPRRPPVLPDRAGRARPVGRCPGDPGRVAAADARPTTPRHPVRP